MSTHVVILGAGFGGLELSSRLSAGLADEVRVTLIDQGDSFVFSDETSDALTGLLDERGIRHSHASWIDRLDPATKVAHLKDGRELPFDLFLAVPVHRAPPVVVHSGLTEDGWIPVDPATFATALFTPPSLEGAEDKRRFAAFRRDRWFGPRSGAGLPDGTTPDAPSPDEESHEHYPA